MQIPYAYGIQCHILESETMPLVIAIWHVRNLIIDHTPLKSSESAFHACRDLSMLSCIALPCTQ